MDRTQNVFYFHLLLLWLFTSGTRQDSTLSPRMAFTHEETSLQSVTLPAAQHPLVQILLGQEPDTLTAVGKRHLLSVHFQNPPKTVERKLVWADCGDSETSPSDCGYEVVVALKRENGGRLVLCGTDGLETVCCDTNPLEDSPTCKPAGDLQSIRGTIRSFIVKDGEHSTLVESTNGSSSLYITYSGSRDYVGIHKFGKNRVGPANHDKEQHYLGVLFSSRREDPLQDQVYAFYKERNQDTGFFSSTWIPYVTRVCVADMGGPKNNLQFTWTSQMSARLYCGHQDSRQSFFHLVDVSTVPADRWQDTRVYALFRNEWNMSGVCVYAMQDIHSVFASSPFKGKGQQRSRPRECVADSTSLSMDVLKMIQTTSEMEQWVWPMNRSGPLLLSHHVYTHIYADAVVSRENPVLFLSLVSGTVHKVVQNQGRAFIVAEYTPFNHRTHISSIILHLSSKKLYVSSNSQLVQVDVADCARYGKTCEELMLARDPYCSRARAPCATKTSADFLMKDETPGIDNICTTLASLHLSKDGLTVPLAPQSKYFLQCPTSSRHAHYTWCHQGEQAPCDWSRRDCLLLIDSMGPRHEGHYECVSVEGGYRRVLTRYRLLLSEGSPRPSMCTTSGGHRRPGGGSEKQI
ncbi:semaphorin-7A isoform X1 [Nerophis ophidion]|uniref:semaphorin-7A isoform X1 n=1 Tax=Nerophis ophidion TaxID=159077 RepID=UPI002AE0739B|nr:semaphorin-7A isoform X1 [Nerophis ophidion]